MGTTDIIINNNTYDGIDTINVPRANGFAIFRLGYGAIIDESNIVLPSGYTLLPSVTFAQNSYFMTDVNLTSADVIEVSFQYTSYVYNNGTIFSDRSASGYGFKFNSATSMYTYRGGTQKTATVNALPNEMVTLVIFAEDKVAYADGTVLATGFTDGGRTSGNVMSIGESNQAIIGSMGKLKVIRDGVLYREYVPCKNESNVVGFYELVTETFYSSAGTAFSE